MATKKTSPKAVAAGAPVVAFVDGVEGAVARLLIAGKAHRYPAVLLPPDVREGMWIELRIRRIDGPPDDTATRRAKLAARDPGGDIKL